MQEKITQLSDEDRAHLNELREWLRRHFAENERAKYEEIGGKLAVVQT
jgi:rubrerythrin